MQDIGVLAEFMTQFWKLIKETYDQPTDEEQNNRYWQEMFKMAHEIAKTYGEYQLPKHLIMAYLDYQEGVYRERKKNA